MAAPTPTPLSSAEPTCLPCFMMVGLAVVVRWVELTNPLVPKRPRRAEGTFRDGIWYWRGFRLPMPPPTEPAVGRELDCPKPRLWERTEKNQRA